MAKLREEYEKSLAILRPIKSALAWTDGVIDQVVYQLYGLTEEEIKKWWKERSRNGCNYEISQPGICHFLPIAGIVVCVSDGVNISDCADPNFASTLFRILPKILMLHNSLFPLLYCSGLRLFSKTV